MKTLPYGEGALRLPQRMRGWSSLLSKGLPLAGTSEPLLGAALTEAAAWCAGRVRGTPGRVALVVPDRTRPLPLRSWVPRFLARLDEAGVSRANRVIVPASGIHAPMSVDELRGWVGVENSACGPRLEPHDADAPSAHVGTSASGIAVRVHRSVAAADALIAIGRLVFHYLAGFGGGRKMIVPGCADRDTVLAMHRRCLAAPGGLGRHPRARAGVLEGNPVHEASCEMVALFPEARCVHVGLDRAGRAALARFGDLVDDHARAARDFGAAHRIRVSRPLEALVVSAGGHPVDRDLVQAHKALDAVAPILAPGAEVLLVARCADGPGNPEVGEALRLGSSRAIAASLEDNFLVGAHSALALREKTERFRVSLVSELPSELAEAAGMRPVASIENWLSGLPARIEHEAALAPVGASALYELETGLAGL